MVVFGLVGILHATSVSEWKMDEASWNGTTGEVRDSVGSNDGTAKNGATAVAGGVSGNAGSFDGIDDYVEFSSELAPLRSTGSLSVWIKTTQSGDNTDWRAPGITGIEGAGDTDDVFWGWIDASGHIHISKGDDTGAASTTVINDDQWHHAVFTRDSTSGEVVVYIDGTEEGRVTGTAGDVSVSHGFNRLGSIMDTGNTPTYYQGLMDEVEVFDTVLTPEEVRQLYFKYHKIPVPTVEYRMDECYWLDQSVEKSVKERVNALNGGVYNGAQPDRNEKVVGFASGGFDGTDDYVEVDDNAKIDMTDAMTVAFWVYPTAYDASKSNFFVFKRGSSEGWGTRVYHITDKVDFFVRIGSGGGSWKTAEVDIPSNWLNHWHYYVGRYDGTSVSIRLIDNTNDLSGMVTASGSIVVSAQPMQMAYNYYGSSAGKYFQGYLDEVKIWDCALNEAEVQAIYDNESTGKNYDGTTRPGVSCTASVTANTWELVGIPADFRNPNNTKMTVADIFGDDLGGTYGTDWRIYRRDYSDTNNSSWYTNLAEADALEFGKGYWLGSKLSGNWSENGAAGVDYDSTVPACTASRCVEIDLKSVTNDYDDGTGSYRYNMSGFVGKTPVDWADCRFIIGGTAYTPSEAAAQGYAAKQIWQYNPGDSGANGNGYTTCDDTMTSCLLEPYRGFWIELHGPTKGKTVKLLIPKE